MEYILPTKQTSTWLRGSLSLGPSLSLAKHVAETRDLTKFVYKTFAKKGLTEPDLAKFSEGGKAEAADDWLMDLLVQSPLGLDGMLLVEDWRPTADSEFLIRDNFPTVFVDKEVYFIVRERDPRNVAHWRRIFSNTVPTFHAFLLDDDRRLTPGCTIDHETLGQVARGLRMIVAGAYDGESYVLATPAKS